MYHASVILSVFRSCRIKEDETKAGKIFGECKNTFSTCQKALRTEGFNIMSACHLSVNHMVKMSTQLSSNVQKMGQVETSVKTNKRNAKEPLSCSAAISMMGTIGEMAYENPSTAVISEMSTLISEANINCNGKDKDVLQNSTKEFAKARLFVNNTLSAIQENLLSKYMSCELR